MHDVVSALIAMQKDVSAVVHLYKQLYDASLYAIVQAGANVAVASMAFLSYDTKDGIREVPLFTSPALANEFQRPSDAIVMSFDGRMLWPLLAAVLPEDGSTQAAVDPMREYGVRLTRAMLLGMVNEHKVPSAA